MAMKGTSITETEDHPPVHIRKWQLTGCGWWAKVPALWKFGNQHGLLIRLRPRLCV